MGMGDGQGESGPDLDLECRFEFIEGVAEWSPLCQLSFRPSGARSSRGKRNLWTGKMKTKTCQGTSPRTPHRPLNKDLPQER